MHDVVDAGRAQARRDELTARSRLAHDVPGRGAAEASLQLGRIDLFERNVHCAGDAQQCEFAGAANIDQIDCTCLRNFGELQRRHAAYRNLSRIVFGSAPHSARSSRISAAQEVGRHCLVNPFRIGQLQRLHDLQKLGATPACNASIEFLFFADAADAPPVVVVAGINQIERLGAATLEISPAAAADQQRVAGKDTIAPQIADAARCVPGGREHHDLLLAEQNHVTVRKIALVSARVAFARNRGLRTSLLLQRRSGRDVIGVHVRFQRPLQVQAMFAQQLQIAAELLEHRIDQHRFMRGVVRQQIAVRAGFRIEQLTKRHLTAFDTQRVATARGGQNCRRSRRAARPSSARLAPRNPGTRSKRAHQTLPKRQRPAVAHPPVKFDLAGRRLRM